MAEPAGKLASKTNSEKPEAFMAGTLVDEADKEVLQVSFEAVQPNEDDFWGMRTLVRQMFVRSEVNYGAISDFIIANPGTATAVKVTDQNRDTIQPAKKAKRDKEATEAAEAQAEDDHYNVYGLVAALNVKDLKANGILKEVKVWMAGHIQDMEFKTKLAAVLKDKTTLFVIAERFVNLPPQIAVGLYQALHGDITKAVEEGNMSAPSKVVMVVKGWKPKGEADPEKQGLQLTCDEDDHFLSAASDKAEFEIVAPSDDDNNYPVRTFRSVLIIDYAHFQATCQMLGQAFATVYDDEERIGDDKA
eukprot:m.29778 g.29778  ORF g.29778 m.29778 type:complete len:304 (-) comp11974_c0_seq1:74-985(-)